MKMLYAGDKWINLLLVFIMHMLQNSSDNRGMITLCDFMSL